MKEKFKLYGSIFILIIFVPYLLTVWVRGGFGGKQTDPVQKQIEEQLPFVVAREISIDSESECLKAQTIIARTNLWKSYQKALAEAQTDEDAAGKTQTGENVSEENLSAKKRQEKVQQVKMTQTKVKRFRTQI